MEPRKEPKLKLKYSMLGLLFVLSCIAIAGYPVWVIAQWLAEILAIPEGVPVKEQENGWIWVALFLLEAVAIFAVCYGSLSLLFSKVNGWSTELYSNVFWKNKYPHHWYSE